MQLYTKIMIALVLGVVIGLVANLLGLDWLVAFLVGIRQFGDAWIDLITMVVIPLVVASLIVGTASLGDITKVGRIGGKTMAYYLATTAVAVVIGLVLSNIFLRNPGMSEEALAGLRGTYLEEGQSRVELAERAPGLVEVLRGIIPRNPIEALANFEMLPILFFSVFFGAALSVLATAKREPVLNFFEGVNSAATVMIHWIMKLAPYAVFALIGAVIAQFGADVLGSLLIYSLVVVLGLLLHLGLTYMAALRFLGGNILQNNAVQTSASAGESLAAGVIFVIPALVMLGVWAEFKYWETTVLAGFGGLLGFSCIYNRGIGLRRTDT